MGIQEAKRIIDFARSEDSDTLILSSLGLTAKDLEILIPDIAKTNITKLYLIDNPFQDLPQSIDKLQHLIQLHIEANSLKTLPESIGNLTNLKELYVSGDHLMELPKCVIEITGLTKLNVSGTKILYLPDTISKLKNLVQLSISGSDLFYIPESIGKLSNLRELNVSGNFLKYLPNSITKLSNLRELRISGNRFIALPKSINKLSNLAQLQVSGDNFKALPKSINKLKNLRELRVSGNRFKALPKSIDKLSLTQLSVKGNIFKALPESICELEYLTELTVSGDSFTVLPESIGDLSNLVYLNLSNSAILEIPESLGRLQNLQQINITNCPVTNETMIWLNRTFPEITVDYNMAARSNNQSAEEVLKLVYSNPNELASLMNNLENCDLDPGIVFYGEPPRGQSKPAKEIIKEFLGKTQINELHELDFYGPPIKSILDNILNKELFPREERANNLAEMATHMGNCATPIRARVVQEAVKLLLTQEDTSSPIKQAIIEREALKNATSKLTGYKLNEKGEQLAGLINSIYLKQAETYSGNPNLQIMGERIRLPSISPNVDYAFYQIQDNPILIKNFVGLVCQTNTNYRSIPDRDRYCLDNTKIKRIKEEYIAELGFETEHQKEIKRHLNMYSREMVEFLQENEKLSTYYYKEAKHLLDIPSHIKELNGLLAKGPIKEEYEKFLCQKKSKIITFLDEIKNPKLQPEKFTMPINERGNPGPKNPGRSDTKQTNETRLVTRL